MALTSHSDFYVSVNDAGINRIVKHLMRQRPSLFNYGTSFVLRSSELFCQRIDAAPEVLEAGNQLITVLDPLPLIGTNLGLNFLVQLTEAKIDFHPNNIISLPPELSPLANQRLGFNFQVCAGIGCPTDRLPLPRKFISSVLTTTRLSTSRAFVGGSISQPPKGEVFLPVQENIVVIPTSKLECFCLGIFAIAGAKITGPAGNQTILPTIDDIEIVDLKPDGLENSIECYALLALNNGIIPPLADSISNLAFNIIDLPQNMGKLRVSGSQIVPNNPAIEEDQLKAFINLDQVELNIKIDPIDCKLPSGGGGPTINRTTRSRMRTGKFDITTAVSEKAFEKIFAAVVKGFKVFCSDNGRFGPFSAHYAVGAHLEGGSIDLRSNGTIKVSELDVKWDALNLSFCIDIPEICTPGGCIIPIPFDGCLLDVPSYCFFSGNPDLCIPIDLSGLLTSEISFTAGVKVFYGTSSGLPNRWQIVLVPTLPFDLDIIDIADTIGDLLEKSVKAAIDVLLAGFPDWAKDVFKFLFGSIVDFIRFALDIPDDIGEWLLDALTDLGVFNVLLAALDGFLTDLVPPLEIEDPIPVLPAEDGLIPVRLPLEFIGIRINSDELITEGDIGN
jgi:hypothetical protein